MINIQRLLIARFVLVISLLLPAFSAGAQDWTSVTTADNSWPQARHESGAVVANGKVYLFGGRGERGVDVYDPNENIWQSVAQAPLELHHFQPVVYAGKIYIIGAFTCCFPLEPTIADIHVFDPDTNTWSVNGTMPANRLRGAAGTVVHQNKIYVIGGNSLGHSGGAVNWFDEYDPATGVWRTLPDAPYARDHFSAAIADGKLVATGGRQSNRSFANTVSATDVFDFSNGTWNSTSHNIPTPRAGTMAVVYDDKVYVLGGESSLQTSAHAEAQVFDPASGLWSQLTPMINPRHAGGGVRIGNELHVFAGSHIRGASGEFDGHEKIDLSLAALTPLDGTPPLLITQDTDADGVPDYDENTVHGTDPSKYDTDDDGINDYEELFTTKTNPNNPDSDSDGVTDNDELQLGLDPNNPDFDSDRISDGDEINIYKSSPLKDDTDDDGIKDGDEVLVYGSNPVDVDSDNDNLADGFEIFTLGSNPADSDTDNDGLRDDLEQLLYGTDLKLADTDGDNVDDGVEVNTFNSNPVSDDTDGDGLKDGDEVAAGSSLTNIDEDGDGLANSAEGPYDSDGDGIANYKDRDSDNDGIPDLIENGFSDVDRDGVLDTLEEIEAAEQSPSESLPEEQEQEQKPEDENTVVDAPKPKPSQRETRSVLLADETTENINNAIDQATKLDSTDNGIDSPITTVAPVPVNIALDSDNDGVPNHIDLDSDQDGISDLVESSIDFTSNTLSKTLAADANQDGLDDSYSAFNSVHPVDSDADGTSNFLDLDSDNDGVFDLVEAGLDDINEDGQLDSFNDVNNDGMADQGIPLLGEALPDEDNDDIPDLIDTEIQTGGRFGCTIVNADSKAAIDPTLPAILLLLVIQLFGRRYIMAGQR